MHRVGTFRCLGAAMLFGASAPAASVLAGALSPMVLAGLPYLGAALEVHHEHLPHPAFTGRHRHRHTHAELTHTHLPHHTHGED